MKKKESDAVKPPLSQYTEIRMQNEHKCGNCNQIKPAKYRRQRCSEPVYYCSDKCLCERFGIINRIACRHCGKAIQDISKALTLNDRGNIPLNRIYCSMECLLDDNCIFIEESES